MANILVVTRDPRIPPDITSSDYEVWSKEEFIAGAGSDEGISIESALYYNIDSLDEDIYNAIREGLDIHTVYYTFSDVSVNLPFEIKEGLIRYEVAPPQPVEPPVQPTPVQEEPLFEEELYKALQETQAKEQPAPVLPPVQTPPVQEERFPEQEELKIADLSVLSGNEGVVAPNILNTQNIENLLLYDAPDQVSTVTKETPAKVILFGSSKGGTGKTFTCLLSAYRYAKTHPEKRVALADFDIIDGQIGITINKNNPTLADFYRQYKAGNTDFSYLSNMIVKNEHFSANLDFYLAPPMDVPEITNNTEFWRHVFKLLITNYDTVFFDTGIDYLGKEPISKIYKFADKIILTSNTSINSVKSIIKQLQTLSGKRKNNVYSAELKLLDKVSIVLTRVSSSNATNDIVIANLTKYAPIVAAFGNIDDQISKSQWYQQWEIWDYEDKVNKYLDQIVSLD